MAHGFLQSFDNKLDVFSAGTKPAEKVNPMAVKVMEEMGIDLTHHTPKSVNLYQYKTIFKKQTDKIETDPVVITEFFCMFLEDVKRELCEKQWNLIF